MVEVKPNLGGNKRGRYKKKKRDEGQLCFTERERRDRKLI